MTTDHRTPRKRHGVVGWCWPGWSHTRRDRPIEPITQGGHMTERDMDGDPDWLPKQTPATMPDPGEATTVQEFVCRLRAFKAWSGNPVRRSSSRSDGLP